MSLFGIRRSLAVVVVVALIGAFPAHAGTVLGASFGYTHISYPDVSDFSNNIIGIPGSQEWGQPGLRVGYLSPDHPWELNADIGFVHRSGPNFSDQTTLQFLPQVQLHRGDPDRFSPFVNAGLGLQYETALTSATESVSATRPVFGAGVGVRKAVSEGHGFVRMELRYDHLPKDEQDLSPFATFTFPTTDLFSVKLGFDLLVTH